MAKLLRPQFVLFGDSITQQSFEDGGWGAALAALYARQVSFYLSFLSQPISSFASFLPSFVSLLMWIGMQEVRRAETVQRWWWWWWWFLLLRLLFLSFFSPSPLPLECFAWFALEQEEWALMYSFRVQADVILRGYSGYNTSWALFVLDRIFPKVRDSRDDG